MTRFCAGSDAVRQHALPSLGCIADTLRHASQKHHEGGFERIRQQERDVELTVSDVAGNANPICQTRWFGFAPHLVYEWRGCVKSCYKRANQYSNFGIR